MNMVTGILKGHCNLCVSTTLFSVKLFRFLKRKEQVQFTKVRFRKKNQIINFSLIFKTLKNECTFFVLWTIIYTLKDVSYLKVFDNFVFLSNFLFICCFIGHLCRYMLNKKNSFWKLTKNMCIMAEQWWHACIYRLLCHTR